MRKLFNFINNEWRSYWFKSGFFALIGRSSGTVIGFLNFLILVRVLGPGDFGTWTLFLSMCTFLELWKSGFIRSPLLRYLSAEKGETYARILNSSLVLNGIISLGQVILLIGFSFFLSRAWNAPELKPMFLIYIGSTVFNIANSHFVYLQQANLNFKGGFLSNLTRQILLLLYIAVVFFLGEKISLIHLAIVQVIATFFSTVIAIIYGVRYMVFRFTFSREWTFRLFHYGKYTLGTNLSSTILRNVDTWMLGFLINPAAVGLYNPAMKLSNIFELPTSALTTIAFPKLVQRIKKEGGKAAKYLYEKSLGLMLAVLVPTVIAVILLAEPIILVIAGKDYMGAVPVLRVTMLYGLIIPFNRQVGITLDALGEARTNFLFVLRNAVINVVLNFIFIKQFGVIGAAYASLITYVFVLVYNQYYIHRKLNIKISRMVYFMGFFYKRSYYKVKNLIFI